jgi:hypothetical protein
MLTIVWNPNGFHFINILSKGIKFNAGHYIIDALLSIGGMAQNSGWWNRSKIAHPCR